MIRRILACSASALALAATASGATTLGYTGAIEALTLQPGTYAFTAAGAAGGATIAYYGVPSPGYAGHVVSGRFTLASAATFEVLVGGQGGYGAVTASYGESGGGGGGGLFVVEEGSPFIVAGGGGGGVIFPDIGIYAPHQSGTSGGGGAGGVGFSFYAYPRQIYFGEAGAGGGF
ncbi:MAG TPA: glycine-rich protein [Caulobacteraceae bacterium]|nr:glycine-rich protein [Caulobacteraceae bacterium]